MFVNGCPRCLDVKPCTEVRRLAEKPLMDRYEDLEPARAFYHRPTKASRNEAGANSVDNHIDSAQKHFAHASKEEYEVVE